MTRRGGAQVNLPDLNVVATALVHLVRTIDVSECDLNAVGRTRPDSAKAVISRLTSVPQRSDVQGEDANGGR